MYNGFESQDAFHAWMRQRWSEMHAQGIAAQLNHARCDHANGYCGEG